MSSVDLYILEKRARLRRALAFLARASRAQYSSALARFARSRLGVSGRSYAKCASEARLMLDFRGEVTQNAVVNLTVKTY